MFESFFSVFLDWPHAFFIIFKTKLYFSGIITPVFGSMWFPSKKIYSAFLLSSSRGGLLLSWKMENPPHFLLLWSQPKTEFRRNSFWQVLRSYSASGVLLSSTKNGWFSSFPPLVEYPPCSICLRRVLEKRSPSEFHFRRFRQFQILPQEVSRVESKIWLYRENKTVIVLNKIMFPRIWYLCLLISNTLTKI